MSGGNIAVHGGLSLRHPGATRVPAGEQMPGRGPAPTD
jgi:hypothetical protein